MAGLLLRKGGCLKYYKCDSILLLKLNKTGGGIEKKNQEKTNCDRKSIKTQDSGAKILKIKAN